MLSITTCRSCIVNRKLGLSSSKTLRQFIAFDGSAKIELMSSQSARTHSKSECVTSPLLPGLRANLACNRLGDQRRFYQTLNATKTYFAGSSIAVVKPKKMSSVKNQQNENILTVPNILCITRIALSPVIAYLLLHSEHTLALALLGVASFTDMLDGFIARNVANQSSIFGSMLDPVADKVLMTTMTVTLAYVNLLPAFLCALIVGRDVGIMSAVAYLRFKTVPRPITISKFFDVNLPTVQMKPTLISKVNTALQLSLVGLCMAAPVFDFVDSQWLYAYCYLVGATTIASGMSYVIMGSQTFRVVK